MALETQECTDTNIETPLHTLEAVWLLPVGSCWQFLAQTYAQKHLLDLVDLREENS